MKVWTLIENTACREDLAAEHGLSLYIETGTRKILFDTGKTGAFADNAEKMGIDLRKVDLCVLSHGHYDHGGGIARFLEINDHAPVYISRHAFSQCYSSGKYIGLDPALEGNPRLIPVADHHILADGVALRSCNELSRPRPFGTFGQTLLEQGNHIPDGYLHEQYLLVEEAEKKICVSGCSHKGIENILHWFRPDVMVGGFHFIKMDPESDIFTAAANRLGARPTVYYTGHCTGQAQYRALKDLLGDRLEYLSGGNCFDL